MFLVTFTKKDISTKELKRQIWHKRYEPSGPMIKKIRTLK
jgi:hypothetical protein